VVKKTKNTFELEQGKTEKARQAANNVGWKKGNIKKGQRNGKKRGNPR